MARNRKVAILGAGPAGLLAAHAAQGLGYNPYVFSRPGPIGSAAKSALWGCQYLHAHIAGLGLREAGEVVEYLLEGDPEGYRAKVYGTAHSGQTSVDEYGPERTHLAWDLRAAYERLWERWQYRIRPGHLEAQAMDSILSKEYGFHRVFSTIPANALCYNDEHKFVTQSVYAIGSAPGNTLPFTPPPFTVQCNGHKAPRWYRAANVYGYSTIEWPAGPKPPIAGVVAVDKPLRTDCDCWLGFNSFRRVGRYGQWAKGVLVHQVYEQVIKELS